jgi:hypothetical protein
MSHGQLDQRAAEAMVRLLHEHRRGGGEHALAAVIHPEAEMRLLITYGTVLHGGATEAVKALLTWARQQQGVRAVIAHCHPDNHASIRVLEKAGMATTETGDELLAWSTTAT